MKRAGAALTALVLAAAGVAPACRARQEAPAPAARAGTSPGSPVAVPIPIPTVGFVDETGMGEPADGGTLERRLVGEPTTLNAVLQSALPEAQVLQYVQRNLFDFDAHLRLVPGLERFLVHLLRPLR